MSGQWLVLICRLAFINFTFSIKFVIFPFCYRLKINQKVMTIKLKIIILVRVIESFFNHSIFAWQNGRLSPPSALPLICVWFLPLMFFGLDLLSYWWLSLTVCKVISTNWTTLWGWFLATDGHFQYCWRVTRSHLCPFWCCLGNHTMSTWLTRQQSVRGHLGFQAAIQPAVQVYFGVQCVW